MKLNREEILRTIMASLAEEGVSIPELPSDLSQLRLLGEKALVKSVGLVAMLVGVEQRLAEEHGIEISLMDERAMSQTRSPFRSVGSLLEYIERLIAAPTA